MNILKIMGSGLWTVIWITTVYSYAACSCIGFYTGWKKKKSEIEPAIEKFIISPFYVATFFTIFSALFILEAAHIKNITGSFSFCDGVLFGFIVFAAHLVIELVEDIFIRKDPLRILGDKDALRLTMVYCIVIIINSFVVVHL